MSNTENFDALITLLEDSDREVFEHVFDKLKSYGDEIIPNLETAWEESPNEILQTRIEDLIHQIQYDKFFKEFKTWLDSEEHDLIDGALLMAKYQYKVVKAQEVHNKIEQLRKDIWLELNEYLTAVEKVKVFNSIFYDVHKFKGDAINFQDPLHSYINAVVDSKTGNSITLGIIYLAVAKKLNLPIHGINLPHHFVLGYIDQDELSLKLFEDDAEDEQNILFYINPFNEGAIFTQNEIKIYLEKLKIMPDETGKYDPRFFDPCSNLQIIEVLVDSLIKAYENVGSPTKAEELKEVKKMIKDKKS